MPLEIRELVIKASIGSGSENGDASRNDTEKKDASEANVNLIVEKVLQILKEKSER